MLSLSLFHFQTNPLTLFKKITKNDLAIKIVVLTDFDSGWTNAYKLCPTELKLGLWV